MVHSSQFISGLSLSGGQLVDRMEAMAIDEPNALGSPPAGSSVSSSARNSRTSSTTSLSACSDSQTQTRTRRRSSSLRRPSFSKVKRQVASAGFKFAAGMVSLPIIGELLEGVCDSVRDYENMGSNRHGLAELEKSVEAILNMLNSEPQLLATDREYAHFTDCIQNLHIEVNSELQAGLVRRLDTATRLDEFNRELTDLLAEAIKAGHLVQKRVVVPEEFDSTIPSLKIVNERNGLVISEHISTRRYDGTSVNDIRDQLHVYTYQAIYNDVPVEVEDYCGGPDNYLIQTLTELVDDYNQRGLNPVLQRLYGGFVFNDQSGRLHAYLVLSPREGTPWVKLVKAKQSIELLCQVAEKTAIVFKQLKQNKQMNFDDIHVRSDGTLLLVPHTEGDNFLLDEDVFDPSDIKDGEYEIGWPFDDLCRLLHESSKQGLVPEAVAALREHDGTWDQIAVWRVGRDIGLRPPPSSRIFNYYPPHHWTINPGWIIHWPEPGSMLNELDGCFNPVVRLPKSMIEEEYEQQHLTSFMIKTAMGKRGDECINYSNQDSGEDWLLPAQEKDWEFFPLEPWQGVESITLAYESVRLELVEWTEWKRALKIVAQKKTSRKKISESRADATRVHAVSRTDVLIKVDKKDIPELGTRPIYFYRRKPGADTSPQQFWGFFTFNQDPLSPTGLTVRCSGPNQRGRIVSESLPPDPPEYEQKWIDLEIEIEYVNMCDDWSLMIKQQREYNRRHKMAPRYSEDTLEWSDWEMDVDQV